MLFSCLRMGFGLRRQRGGEEFRVWGDFGAGGPLRCPHTSSFTQWKCHCGWIAAAKVGRGVNVCVYDIVGGFVESSNVSCIIACRSTASRRWPLCMTVTVSKPESPGSLQGLIVHREGGEEERERARNDDKPRPWGHPGFGRHRRA